ncbi:hypothetical protein ACFE04_031620 [Oxalis oulophora]
MMMEVNNNQLPEDIIIELLLNLPVKSLTRFVCTCKAWYALIRGDHTFIRNHIHRNIEHLLVMYNHPDSDSDSDGWCRSYKFISNQITGSCVLDPNLSHLLQNHSNIDFGYCNGIFCFYNCIDGKGILWNPANRETRELLSPFSLDSHKYCPRFGYSDRHTYCPRFGYSERNNDYKVVVFSNIYVETRPFRGHYRIDIYSLRNDSWRRFKGNVPFYDLDELNHPNCLDEVFYWFQFNKQNYDTGNRLLSFDISNEVFEEIVLPGDRFDEKHFEIWVLSSTSCWNKVLTIGPLTSIMKPLTFIDWSLGFLEHGGKNIHIEEAAVDEEMAEIQATSVLYLWFLSGMVMV